MSCDIRDEEGGAAQAPLVGSTGVDYVLQMLTTNPPPKAISSVQERGGLNNKECRHLLGLLDHLGVSRAEAHQAILAKARAQLLRTMEQLPTEGLLQLLEASFFYMGIPELRQIPVSVLSRLQLVPATYLKRLSSDRDLFQDLPITVQRQVWEVDKNLLQQHVMPLLLSYLSEPPTVSGVLDMLGTSLAAAGRGDPGSSVARGIGGAGGRAGGAAGGRKQGQQTRRAVRAASPGLTKLVEMVGVSRQIYRAIVELCIVKLRDADTPYSGPRLAALCSLRSQLLMTLHDRQATLCTKDQVHKLSWILDACLLERKLDEKKMRELVVFFEGFASSPGKLASGSKRRRSAAEDADGDAESADGLSAVGAEEPSQVLGDAGIVLCDAPVLHFLLRQVVKELQDLVEREQLPRDSKRLSNLTRLVQLACSCRKMLREGSFKLPSASSHLMHHVYPMLAAAIADQQLQPPEAASAAGPLDDEMQPDSALVAALASDEVARRVTQMYIILCLAKGQAGSAARMLATAGAAFNRMGEASAHEWAPFAHGLTRHISSLLAQGRALPGSWLWTRSVDQLIMPVAKIEPFLHKQVLRLVLAAVPKLSLHTLTEYVAMLLSASRSADVEAVLMDVGADDGVAAGAPGWKPLDPGSKDEEEVRSLYQTLLQSAPELTREAVPALFDFLDAKPKEGLQA